MDVMGCSRKISCFWFICVWFVVIFRTTDGGSITWYEPLPVKTETDNTVPSIADSIQLFKGRSGSLSWNFTLTGETFASATLKSKTTTVASIQPAFGIVSVNPGFENRFNVSWIGSQRATLIIFNVTTDDEGDFSCETSSVVQSAFKVWTRKIQVAVVDPPVITQISPNQTVNESDVVPFNCKAEGKPTPNITRTRLSDNSVVNSTIHITGKQDEGFYRCTADNGVGDPVTADFFITVQNYSPENTNLTTNLSDNIADVNTNFNLICSAQANPPAKYRIYKEQESLFNTTTGSNVPVVYTTSVTERINQVKFSCTPFNDFGDGPTVKITITVHYPPEIITEPASQSVKEGNRTTLFCNATGNPPPSFNWTKQGSNSVLSTSNTLTLTNLRRGDNGTVYKCKVQNKLGSAESTAMITVLYPPEIITAPTSQSVIEGNRATLFCNATGDPQPNITWTKQGNDSILSTSDTLTLTNLRRGDNGAVYKCEVQNDLGSDESTATITVLYSPEIVSAPSSEEVVEGDGVVLFCNATGNPKPNITWTKQGSSTVLSSSETLNLTNLMSGDNGAVYICKVENIIGSREANSTVTVLYAPNVTIQQCSTPVNEGKSVTLYCNATGNPVPSIAWIRNSTGEVVSYNKTLNLPNIKRNESGSYECLAWNDIGNNTKSCTIDVYYRPSSSALTTVPSNTTVLHGKTLSLICSTDANPLNSVTYHFYFNDRYIGNSSWGVFNVTVEADGVYTCVPINTVGSGHNASVNVTAVVAPSVEVNKTTYTVVEGNRITLFCNASGEPTPSIKWIRVGSYEILSNTSILTVMNVSRPGTPDNMIQYQCTVSNGVESPATAVSNITVHYPPKITSPKAGKDKAERDATIECDAEGNPSPTYVWRNGTGGVVANGKTFTLTYDGNYTCNASNKVGSDTHSIVIEIPSDYYQGEVPVEELNGVAVDFKPEYNNLKSPPAIVFITKFENEMDKLYANDTTYNRTEVTGLSKGSVIVSFVLYFTTPVTASEGLAKLKAATDNRTLGPFTVGALKIIPNVIPTSTPSVSSTGSTTAVPPVVTTTVSPTEGPPWILIGAIVGGVVVMVVIVAVVAWCVHKKRKCRRKGTKVRHSESDVALEGQVNCGYADSGPPSANGANRTDTSVLLHEQPTAAAPPTYAVVDKKKKKEKKADKKEDDNVAKQNVPDYAVVDKSQKKKKEVVEDAYAQVDMSKKSKKKPKPGEMLYADLGDFQPREMPAVSTSPAPLPPIKRPPAYEETQYADITQFRTGNATLPDANNSQGTEMTYANAGGNEKPKETANEGGNEEKPKDTANGGGNEEKPKDTANGGGNEEKRKETRM